jgi:hypothetical protein
MTAALAGSFRTPFSTSGIPGEAGQDTAPPDSGTGDRPHRQSGGNQVRSWWLTKADGNPQDDSDSGNKHGGGGSDEGGNTNDGQGPADGR